MNTEGCRPKTSVCHIQRTRTFTCDSRWAAGWCYWSGEKSGGRRIWWNPSRGLKTWLEDLQRFTLVLRWSNFIETLNTFKQIPQSCIHLRVFWGLCDFLLWCQDAVNDTEWTLKQMSTASLFTGLTLDLYFLFKYIIKDVFYRHMSQENDKTDMFVLGLSND